jgi:hypothetical protein
MEPVISVQADTPEQCTEWIRLLCDQLGLEPSLRPVRSVGTDRWMARAMPKAQAADGLGFDA